MILRLWILLLLMPLYMARPMRPVLCNKDECAVAKCQCEHGCESKKWCYLTDGLAAKMCKGITIEKSTKYAKYWTYDLCTKKPTTEHTIKTTGVKEIARVPDKITPLMPKDQSNCKCEQACGNKKWCYFWFIRL